MGGCRIEHVIDTVLVDRPATLAAAESTLRGQKALDADLLQVAVGWADLHHPDSLPPAAGRAEVHRRRLNGEYPVQVGGDGTPQVLAGCFFELGTVLETSAGGAKHLVADALDLRHRLPLLWAEATSGRTRAWKARQVAAATRRLPLEAMAEIDAGLAGLLHTLAWTRFATILEATVVRATPGLTRAQEEEAAQRRFVGVGRANDHGILTLIARGTTLDIQTFLAAVKRIADILALEGDTDTADVRRSTAVGILGQPARALALLTRHRDDPDQPGPADHHGAVEASADPLDHEPVKGERVADDDTEPEPEPDETGSRSLDLTPLVDADPAAVAALAKTGPRVQLHVHLTDAALIGTDPCAVARVEGVGPVTASTVRAWLRRPDLQVTIRPVAVPGQAIPVDAYEIPASVREAVLLRTPASMFPWSACTTRTMDLDHIRPYLDPARGGPPGQTSPDGLGPLARREHNPKTGGTFQTRRLAPGVQLWRTPHGWIHLVTNQGTYPLGHDPTAHAIWRAAAPPPDQPPRQRSLLEAYLTDLTRRPLHDLQLAPAWPSEFCARERRRPGHRGDRAWGYERVVLSAPTSHHRP